jgi:dihydroorotase
MYDLLLKGGTVIDPSTCRHGTYDIAIKGETISRIAQNIIDPSHRVVLIKGKTVTPGLIDIHTHVLEGATVQGLNPDLAGVHAGVTTLVDAGSAGCATIGAFPKLIIPRCHTEILCMMHICQTGLATIPDITSAENINLDKTVQAVEEYRDITCGIKVRMVSPALEIWGMEMPRLAKRAAKESGVKLMVHIGDTEKRYPADVIHELLPLLDEGDIVTHLFTANPGGVLDATGKLVPEAKEARERGVWLDTAHGRSNMSFEVGQRVLDQELIPHCISTDLTIPGRLGVVHSMVEMMTRFMAMGFTLKEVITMATANPAKALGLEHRLGSLAEGRQADISVLDIKNGDWMVYDALGQGIRAEKAVVPVLTIKKGQMFEPEWGPRPWGWEPDHAP